VPARFIAAAIKPVELVALNEFRRLQKQWRAQFRGAVSRAGTNVSALIA